MSINSNTEMQSLETLITKTFNELDNHSKNQLEHEEQQYLLTYISILKKMSQEVLAEKMKYRNINKEQLIAQKVMYLSGSIIQTRQEINGKQKELEKLRKELHMMEMQNKVGEFENECMKKAVNKKQIQSSASKEIYLTSVKMQNPKKLNMHLPLRSGEKQFQSQLQIQKKVSNKKSKEKLGYFGIEQSILDKKRPASMKQKNRKYSKFTERKNTSLSYAYKYKAETNLFK